MTCRRRALKIENVAFSDANRISAPDVAALRSLDGVEPIDTLPLVAGLNVDRLIAIRSQRKGRSADIDRFNTPTIHTRTARDLNPVANEIRRNRRRDDECPAARIRLGDAAAHCWQDCGIGCRPTGIVEPQIAVCRTRSLDVDRAGATERSRELRAVAATYLNRRKRGRGIGVFDRDRTTTSRFPFRLARTCLQRAACSVVDAGLNPDRSTCSRTSVVLRSVRSSVGSDLARLHEILRMNVDHTTARRTSECSATTFLRSINAAKGRIIGTARRTIENGRADMTSRNDLIRSSCAGVTGRAAVAIVGCVDRRTTVDVDIVRIDVDACRRQGRQRPMGYERVIQDQEVLEIVMPRNG